MTNLEELLGRLRAAVTAADYDAAIGRLQRAREELGELRERLETEEMKAVFAGQDLEPVRQLRREIGERQETIRLALVEAGKRRQAASEHEARQALAAIGRRVVERELELASRWGRIRECLVQARELIFEVAPLEARQLADNEALLAAQRADLARNVLEARAAAMNGEELPAAPYTLPRSLRDADHVLTGLATGGRPWRGQSLRPVAEAQSSASPSEAVKPFRRTVA